MVQVFFQLQHPFNHAGPTTGVHQPAATQNTFTALPLATHCRLLSGRWLALQVHQVRISRCALAARQFDLSHAGVINQGTAHFDEHFRQMVFQSPSIDLVARRREKLAASHLRAFGEVLKGVFEKETKAKLGQLLFGQMLS